MGSLSDVGGATPRLRRRPRSSAGAAATLGQASIPAVLVGGRPVRETRGFASAVRRIARTVSRHLLPLDLLATVAGAYVAISLRDDRLVSLERATVFLPVVAILLAARGASNAALGLYGRNWRYASVPDLERVVVAIGTGSLLAVAAFVGLSAVRASPLIEGFPRSFWIAEMAFSGGLIGGARFGIRAGFDLVQHSPRRTTERRPTLLYGAGHTGSLLARSASRNGGSDVLPVGFLDDDRSLKGSLVAGIPVFGGLDAMERAVARTHAQALLITMPSAAGGSVRRAVDEALRLGLQVRTVPAIEDLLDGSVDAHRVRRIQVEDLLRRPSVTGRSAAVQDLIRGQTILITGAGGSIGSELARQVFAIGPERLVLVDRAESALYMIQRELESRSLRSPSSCDLRICLANVVSREPMERLLAAERPRVVFHAAAYKHVPLLEDHPSDAVHVNIRGTMVLLDAAAAAGVERFVFVSTDKAVRPSSVMGASKRVAEMLVADAGRQYNRPYLSVRFGNVLGSAGSVVPIFQEQLEHGEPLTITDPAMTRYFMTIPEAAWLILDAAALGETGDLFVLDMGEPVRILDLAHDLVRLSGRDPETQPIEIVGLRPGEKLHEELFYDAERVQKTASPKVLRAVADTPPGSIRGEAIRLLDRASGQDEPGLRQELLALAARLAGDGQQSRPADVPAVSAAASRPAAASSVDDLALFASIRYLDE